MDFTKYFPQSGQTYAFDLISIVFAIVLLSSIVSSAKKGFVTVLIGWVATILSFVLASSFCKPLGAILYNNTGLGEKVYYFIYNWVSGKGETMNVLVNTTNMDATLPPAFETLGIPAFLNSTLLNIIKSMNIITAEDKVLSIAISQGVSAYVFMAIAWFAICAGVSIICSIIIKCLKKVIKKLQLNWVDAILGVLCGIPSAILSCAIVAYIFVVLMSVGMGGIIKTLAAWDDDTKYTVTKALCYFASDIAKLLIRF